MSNRVTRKDLEQLAKIINTAKGYPLEHFKLVRGQFRAPVGKIEIVGAYGGYQAHQFTTNSGGVRQLTHGYVSARELAVFLRGMLEAFDLRPLRELKRKATESAKREQEYQELQADRATQRTKA